MPGCVLFPGYRGRSGSLINGVRAWPRPFKQPGQGAMVPRTVPADGGIALCGHLFPSCIPRIMTIQSGLITYPGFSVGDHRLGGLWRR